MLYFDRIDKNEGTDLAKSKNSKECMIATIVFLIMDLNFNMICCHAIVVVVNINDIAIITFKSVDCRCAICNVSKSEATHLLKNCILENG